MPTVEQNRANWTEHTWAGQGDEWSGLWGGTESLWWGSLLPRFHAFVPTETILEIAPGFGRATQYLKDFCQHLTVVDVTERCIEACKQRFSSSSNITYYVNDGKSLDMIPDHSINVVFSFDSLVHAEPDVIKAYLSQMKRILKPNGMGFIHHSNVGGIPPLIKKIPFIRRALNQGWRSEGMTARLFRQYCEQAELQCVGQEIINRITKYPLPHDCFSLFTLPHSRWARRYRTFTNLGFAYEAAYLAKQARLYSKSSFRAEI